MFILIAHNLRPLIVSLVCCLLRVKSESGSSNRQKEVVIWVEARSLSPTKQPSDAVELRFEAIPRAAKVQMKCVRALRKNSKTRFRGENFA
jgi:hypothetical protein